MKKIKTFWGFIRKKEVSFLRWLIADTRYIQREIKAIISIDIYIIFAIILSLIFKTISNIIPLTNIIRIIITIINQAILFLTPSSIADIIMNRLNEKIESFL